MTGFPHPAIDLWSAEIVAANNKTRADIAVRALDQRDYDYQRGLLAGRVESLRLMDEAIRQHLAPPAEPGAPQPPAPEGFY